MDSMISIRQVSKRYDGVAVVNDVSLEVNRACMTVIVGTSGSGKSTLLRMINRLVAFSDGQIWINGQNILDVPQTQLRRGIGYVIQGHGLFPHRTVAQNIATVPKLLGWSKDAIERRVHELLTMFDLAPAQFANKYPHQLSGGQQQRVGVARALAAKPEILLMDEPFGALDPVIRAKAQDDLLAIQRKLGITVILVTHDMDEAFRLGSKIAIMDQGRLLQYATPEQILTAPADPMCAQLVGTDDRALKLLSLSTVAAAMRPIEDSIISHTAIIVQNQSLRDALSEMTWQGVSQMRVLNAAGKWVGVLSLADILAHGRAYQMADQSTHECKAAIGAREAQ